MITRINLFSLVIFSLIFTGCKTSRPSSAAIPKTGMFKVSILYSGGDDKTFDMDYYEKKHMPMMAGFLGENLAFYEIDKGVAGRTPTEKIPFVAIGYFYIRDVAEYNKAVGQHIDAIRADIKNYTNIQPVVQVSEIKQLVPNNK